MAPHEYPCLRWCQSIVTSPLPGRRAASPHTRAQQRHCTWRMEAHLHATLLQDPRHDQWTRDQGKERPVEAQGYVETDNHGTRGRRVTTHPVRKDGPRECRQAGILNLGPEWLLSSRIRHFQRRERTTAISMVRNRCQLALVQGIYGLNKHRRGRSAGGAGVSS